MPLLGAAGTPSTEQKRRTGMGHLLTAGGRCHYEQRRTTFYEPPHGIRHRQAGPMATNSPDP
jgi:hypothetical protein